MTAAVAANYCMLDEEAGAINAIEEHAEGQGQADVSAAGQADTEGHASAHAEGQAETSAQRPGEATPVDGCRESGDRKADEEVLGEATQGQGVAPERLLVGYQQAAR